MFYSEYFFYGQLNNPGTPLPTVWDLVLRYAIYSLMAHILMALVRCYHSRTLPALLLAGAIYGWMLEGSIVATTYEALPWSLSFTGLAWHMPLEVLIGWYGIQRLLRAATWKQPADINGIPYYGGICLYLVGNPRLENSQPDAGFFHHCPVGVYVVRLGNMEIIPYERTRSIIALHY